MFVRLIEMRPKRTTAAHTTEHLAELVCSNSFKSTETSNAHGLLKAEMRRLGSIVLQAADVLRGNRIEPAVVAIPLDITSDGEILLLSMLINITPGSVTIDLSDDRRTLYVHVMHMTSVDETRREIKDGFERRVRLLFES